MPEGILIKATVETPCYFATVLTDEYGSRSYAFCLQFFDLLLQEGEMGSVPILPHTPSRAEDESNKQPRLISRIVGNAHDITKQAVKAGYFPIMKSAPVNYSESSSTGDAHGLVSSFIAQTETPGHRLGDFGMNLEEQLNYRRKPGADSVSVSDVSGGEEVPGDLSDTSGDASESKKSGAKRLRKLVKTKEKKLRFDSMIEEAAPSNEDLPGTPVSDSADKTSDSNISTGSNGPILPNALAPEQNLYFSKCLVLLSKIPYYNFFRDYLSQVYKYIKSNPKGKSVLIPLDRFLANLMYEVVPPPPGIDIRIQVHGPCSPLYLIRPAPSDLPLLNSPLKTMFYCLDKRNILRMLTGLLVERKIIFVANNIHLIFVVIETIFSLLYPFSWSYVYIPTLPPSLLDYTQAPTPFVMGISSFHIDDIDVTSDVSGIF
jgi:hypothetical protein